MGGPGSGRYPKGSSADDEPEEFGPVDLPLPGDTEDSVKVAINAALKALNAHKISPQHCKIFIEGCTKAGDENKKKWDKAKLAAWKKLVAEAREVAKLGQARVIADRLRDGGAT